MGREKAVSELKCLDLGEEAVLDDLRTIPRALRLGLTEALPSLQALCAAVAGPNLLKNMTQLLCAEASEGEEPWSPSALDGSFPGLLPPGNPCKCIPSLQQFSAPTCALVPPGSCRYPPPTHTPSQAHHNRPTWAVSQTPRSSGTHFWRWHCLGWI